MTADRTEIDQQIASIEAFKVRRAATLAMAEKLRMGADLYDEGMRWMTQAIRAEHPEFDDQQVDAEVERRRQIKRRIDDAGLFKPCSQQSDDV